jgi:hypothetical protein
MRSCLWGLSKARACAQCSIHPEDLENFFDKPWFISPKRNL